MGKERQKRKELRQLLSPLTRFWRHDGKRYCAIALCASLIAGNIGHLAAAASEDPDYKFELDRVALYEALQQAVADGNTVDGDFEFAGLEADTYEISMAADGSLYELTPEIDDNNGSLHLRVFARLDENIDLVDDVSEGIGNETSSYEIDGSEEFYFLLTNTSDQEQTAVIRVGEKETELISVVPYSDVEVPEPEGKASVNAVSDGVQAGAAGTQEVGPGVANTEGTGEISTGTVTAGGIGSSGGGGGSGGGGSSGDLTVKNDTAVDVEISTEAATSPEIETEVKVEETEMAVPETEVKVEETEAAVPETEVHVPEMETPETEAGNTESAGSGAPAESEDSTEIENEAPENDVDVTIDVEDAGTESGEETEVSVVEDDKIEDAAVDEKDSSNDGGSTNDAAGTSNEDAVSDAADDREAASVDAAGISLHKTYRVASSKATPSDATPSDATPSDASASDMALETLDGTVLNAVRLGDASAVVFVTTADELKVTNDLEKFASPSNAGHLYEASLDTGLVVQVYANEGAFEEDVELSVKELKEDDEETAEDYQAAKDALDAENTEYTGMIALDISFLNDAGDEVEPKNGSVQVCIEMDKAVLPDDVIEETLAVKHLEEDKHGNIENVNTVADNADTEVANVEVDADAAVVTTEFEVESFSKFTIIWQTSSSFSNVFVKYVVENSNSGYTELELNNAQSDTIEITGENYSSFQLSQYVTTDATDENGIKYLFEKVVLADSSGNEIISYTSLDGNTFQGNWYWSDWKTYYRLQYYKNGWVNVDNNSTIYAVYYPKLAESETRIRYDINLQETPSDEEYGTPQIQNGTTYSTITDDSSHTILAPSLTSYFYASGKYLGEATFSGWAVDGNTEPSALIQPNATLDLTDYKGKTVTLTAVWERNLADSTNWNRSMANFFVSLAALPEGTETWEVASNEAQFTGSVYTSDSGITIATAIEQELYDKTTSGNETYYVLNGTSEKLNDAHTLITRNLSTGYTLSGKDGKQYPYKLTFPTDEEVLRTVRSMQESASEDKKIKVNGTPVAVDDLTTENFVVKWYVFKCSTNQWARDGWHIDGVLVAKTGKLLVTKTFAGDQTAIDAIKDNYYINVEATSDTDQVGIVHEGCQLTLENFRSYSSNTNTYTWEVDVDQYYRYTLTENKYSSDKSLMTTTAQYKVSNSKQTSENTKGWQIYSTDKTVEVTGRGYNSQDVERLTVDFLNTYTAAGTLIIQKVDASTGNRISNVSFRIKDSDGKDFTMYETSNAHYSAKKNNGRETSVITTDYSGQAYLWIGGGTYILEEFVPTGYDDPGQITVTLQGDRENAYKIIAINSAVAQNDSTDLSYVSKGTNSLELIINNYSRTVDLTIEKIWADNENKAVEVQLYRNDVSLGDGYKATFNESSGWEKTFKDVPLYADGGLAQYSVREISLGDFKYSEDYSDGYQYYDVSYSNMVYYDQNEAETPDMSKVKTIKLSVTNKRSTGALFVSKVDSKGNALAGAEFYLYAVPDTEVDENATPSYSVAQDSDGHNVIEGVSYLKTVTSTQDGRVNFGNMNAGVYYLVEHSAPNGYKESADLYRLVFSGTDAVMYRWNENTWQLVSDNKVINAPSTTSINITKMVSGNLGDRSKAFKFEVTLSSGDGEEQVVHKLEATTDYSVSENGVISFDLQHGETVTLQCVPIGATLVVKELEADGYEASIESKAGENTVSGTGDVKGSEGYSVTVEAGLNVTVTNDKTDTVDTGILLDSMPYVLILAAAIAGAAFYFIRKKKEDEDDLD